MFPERRRYSRQQVLELGIHADVGLTNGGNLLDLSEGGLAIQLASPVKNEPYIHLEFDLPETGSRIEANCRIAWTDASGRTAGVEFVSISEEARQRIRDWLSLRASPVGPDKTIASEPVAGGQQLESPPVSSGPAEGPELDSRPPADFERAPAQPEEIGELRPSAHETLELGGRGIGEMVPETHSRVMLFAGVVALCGATFVLGYLLGRGQASSRSSAALSNVVQPMAPPSEAPAPAAKLPSPSEASPAPAEAPAVPAAGAHSAPPAVPRGRIVLQLAALTEEASASAMAEALRKKGFPAFVLGPGADQFYRVQVGPYSDVPAARAASRRLEKAGFKPFLRHF